MLVFVDESGDPGVKGKPNSSAYFVVTAVVFSSQETADACDRAIDNFRNNLGWHPRHEFKFTKLSPQLRRKFLRIVAEYEFSYFAFVLDKQKLTGPGFQHKKSFYKYPVRLLFQNAKPYLEEATVVIDKCGERQFRKEISRYLKRHTNDSDEETKSIKKVRMEDSHRNNLLQLADMVCGAVARSLKKEKSDWRAYRALIAGRETHYQKWPL